MTSSEDDEDNKIRCDICNLGYSTHSALNLHKQSQHRDGKIHQSCEFCGKCFLHYSDLIKHHNEEHNDRVPGVLENPNHNRRQTSRKYHKLNINNLNTDTDIDDGQFTSAFNGTCKFKR